VLVVAPAAPSAVAKRRERKNEHNEGEREMPWRERERCCGDQGEGKELLGLRSPPPFFFIKKPFAFEHSKFLKKEGNGTKNFVNLTLVDLDNKCPARSTPTKQN